MNLVECMYNLRELVKVDEILRKNLRFLGGNVMLNKPISNRLLCLFVAVEGVW